MENQITVYDEFKAELEVFKAADAEKVFDVTTPEGLADCRAYHKKLRKVWNGVDKLRLSTTKEMRQSVKDANEEGNNILAEIDAMANPRKALIDAEEKKVQDEIDRKAAEAEALAKYEEDEGLAWLEYRERAAQAIIDAAAEKEREAKEAAEKVKRDEEAAAKQAQAVKDALAQVEQDKKDEAAKAEQEKQDALDKAEEEKQAEIAAIQAKQHQEKNDRIAAQLKEDNEKAARVADVKHRTNIHLAIKESILPYAKNGANADMFIAALADGRIPNVQIVY